MERLKTIGIIFLAFVIGSVVNMALVTIGPAIIPPPPGVNMADADSLAQSVHLLEARHFLFPFLAHALGTFSAALVCSFFLTNTKLTYVIGVLFLCGGIAAAFLIPAPVWFIAMDLLLAYIPMCYLAIWLSHKKESSPVLSG